MRGARSLQVVESLLEIQKGSLVGGTGRVVTRSSVELAESLGLFMEV